MIVFLKTVRKDWSSLYNISFGTVYFNEWEEIFQIKSMIFCGFIVSFYWKIKYPEFQI